MTKMGRSSFFAIMTTPIPEPFCSACWFGHEVSALLWLGTLTKLHRMMVNFSLMLAGGIGLFAWPRLENGKKRRSDSMVSSPIGRRCPRLRWLKGSSTQPCCCQTDHRERALYVVPIYQDVTPNLVTEAENYHSRAATCFEFAEQSLKDIADHNLARFTLRIGVSGSV